MDVKGLLNQFLNSGSASGYVEQGKKVLEKTGITRSDSNGNSKLSDMSKGALGGSLVTMLLSSKKARKVGGNALTVGGVVGLGAIAYKAYQSWQQKKETPEFAEPKTEQHFLKQTVADDDTVILRAMIAVAKADGYIDDDEKAKIQQAVDSLGSGSDIQQLVQQKMEKPLDPAEIARAATTPEVRSQVYLASLLVADDQNFMEKTYLQELARQLDLEPSLVKELEAQITSQH